MVILPELAAPPPAQFLPPWLNLATALLLNALVAIVSAGFAFLLSRRASHAQWQFRDFLVLWMLGACIPIIGPFILVPAVVKLSRLGKAGPRPIPTHLETPAYAPEISAQPTHFSAGGAIKRLIDPSVPSDSAVLALLALDQHNTPSDTKVLQQTLGHQNDYLRLLAFSMLERREKRILELIHTLHESLEDNPDPGQLGRFHKELAYLHWELLYQVLSQEDLQQFHLEQASFHLQLALELLPEDTGLWILQARMALRAKAFDVADNALQHALYFHAPPSRIAPYAAEYAYIERHFEQIPYFFREAPTLAWQPALKPVYKLWDTSNAA